MFETEEFPENKFEKDLYSLPAQSRDFYARLYADLCNNAVYNPKEHIAESYSWRAAGRIAANLHNHHYNSEENYLHYYCQGREAELSVNPLVEKTLNQLGWTLVDSLVKGIITSPKDPNAWAQYYLYNSFGPNRCRLSQGTPSERGYCTFYKAPDTSQYAVCNGRVYKIIQTLSAGKITEKQAKARDDFFIKYNPVLANEEQYLFGQKIYDYQTDGPLPVDIPFGTLLARE